MSATCCRSSRTPKWATSSSHWAQVQQSSCSGTARRWPARGALAALLWVLATAGYAQRVPTTQTSIGIFYRPEAPRTPGLSHAFPQPIHVQVEELLEGRVGDRGVPQVVGDDLETEGRPGRDEHAPLPVDDLPPGRLEPHQALVDLLQLAMNDRACFLPTSSHAALPIIDYTIS